MKKELVKAAKILGNSDEMLTDVMEFYSEVVKVVVAKRRKVETENNQSMKKLRLRSPVKYKSLIDRIDNY